MSIGNMSAFSLQNGYRADYEHRMDMKFHKSIELNDEVGNRIVHNLWVFFTKLKTLWLALKDSVKFKFLTDCVTFTRFFI